MSARVWLLAGLLLFGCSEPQTWEPAFDASETGWLMSVWGSSGHDVWSVGGAPTAGVVMHYDGTRWSERPTGLEVPLLDWVYGFGPDDVWVVGRTGTILHWDGAAFSEENSGTTEDLWGIWGSAPSDLWAVGGSGFPEATATLLHRDAAGWSTVTLPPLMRAEVHGLFKVWGSSANDVWVVGQRGAVLHFDGTRWNEELVGTGEDLISVWGTGPDHVAFVGGRGNGVLITWDGATFRRVPLDFLPGLNGVWMGDPDVIHVAGVYGTLLDVAFADGAVVRDDSNFEPLDYHAIFGTPSGGDAHLFTVGGNLGSPTGPFHGIASTRARGSDE